MDEKKTVKVAAVMTRGRYINGFCTDYIHAAFRKLGMPLNIRGGVFYGQAMQAMFEDMVAKEVDVVVTVDGDSLFTADQVRQVITTLLSDDKIDAVASMQPRRGDAILLASKRGEGSLQIDGSPVEVSTAHFGLTALRVAKIAQTPKPWFVCREDAEGGFGDGRIDDDIWFWRQWEKAGNSVYLDPQVCIGHMEEMVAIHDPQTMQARHIYPKDWIESCNL